MKVIYDLEDLSKNIGEFFQVVRKKEKKTQAEVAKISGLSDGYISQIEKGKRDKMINVETADKIANAIFLPSFYDYTGTYISFINGIIEGWLDVDTCFYFTSILSKEYKSTGYIDYNNIVYYDGDDGGTQIAFIDEDIAFWILSFLGISDRTAKELETELKSIEDNYFYIKQGARERTDLYEYSLLPLSGFDVIDYKKDLIFRECKQAFEYVEQFEKEKQIYIAMKKQINFLNKNIYKSKTSTSFLLSSDIGENPIIKRMISIFSDNPMSETEKMLLNNTLDNIEKMRE